MIVGIGLDVVEVAKVRELLADQATFEERVFTAAERQRLRRAGRQGRRAGRPFRRQGSVLQGTGDGMEPGGVVPAGGSATSGRWRAPPGVERAGAERARRAGRETAARHAHPQRRRRRRRRDPRGIRKGMEFSRPAADPRRRPERSPSSWKARATRRGASGARSATTCWRQNHDFDVTTAAPPGEVRRLFKRTVPVGIEHGTVAVLDQHNRHTSRTFRKDIRPTGRHAVVEFGVSVVADRAPDAPRLVARAFQLLGDLQDGVGDRQPGGKLHALPYPSRITAAAATPALWVSVTCSCFTPRARARSAACPLNARRGAPPSARCTSTCRNDTPWLHPVPVP